LTHRRLLVSQFNRDLTTEGYGNRIVDAIQRGQEPPKPNPLTIQTYAWFARHWGDLNPDAYHLVIADEAHTALGEKTSAAIRSFTNPIYIGMTATEQLIAKQVSDVFPASVDDLPLADAARRGLIAPLRSLRVPPAAAIHTVPIVGGDFEERALAQALDHQALNQAAASLYRDRFDSTPGILYAAGLEHAYNLAKEFRAWRLAAQPARLRLLPRGRTRYAGAAAAPAAARPAEALAGALARARHRRRETPARCDHARVAADRPALPRRGRAALLGDDCRSQRPLRRARRVCEEVHRRRRLQGRARDLLGHLRRGEPEPAA